MTIGEIASAINTFPDAGSGGGSKYGWSNAFELPSTYAGEPADVLNVYVEIPDDAVWLILMCNNSLYVQKVKDDPKLTIGHVGTTNTVATIGSSGGKSIVILENNTIANIIITDSLVTKCWYRFIEICEQ